MVRPGITKKLMVGSGKRSVPGYELRVPENPACCGPFCDSGVAHPRAFEDLHEHGEPALHFVHCQLVLMQGNCAAAQLLLQNMARAQAFQLSQTSGTLRSALQADPNERCRALERGCETGSQSSTS